MRAILCLFSLLILTGCANYGAPALHSSTADIEQRLGQPAMRWQETAGGETLVYPTGPMGYHTWFLRTDANGRLIERKNVLDAAHFAKIQAGMNEEQVLRLIGPPQPAWTVYFEARDELVWEWRYCDDWNEPARFNVLFDGTTRLVRSTYAAPEKLRAALDFRYQPRWCGR